MLPFDVLSLALVFSLSSAVRGAIGPVTTLPLVNGEVAPNGISRQAVLPGGTFPGPIISGQKGQTFQIDVLDQLTNETMLTATSVHWHGIKQHDNNWADGTSFITQCPLVENELFQYIFPTNNQAGTFWYHSHLQTQYCDGLRGPLIVYDPDDPHKALYDVDDDGTVITLADWYNEAAVFQPVIVFADSVLINGHDGYVTEPQVITVKQGLRYRFRLIAMSCDLSFIFSIDGHNNLTVIEADGENTEPLTVDSLQIFAAQRYSVVVEAKQPVGNYWIRSIGQSSSTPHNPYARAILRYEGAPNELPTSTNTTSINPLNEVNLHALENPQAPGAPSPNGADQTVNLNVTFDAGISRFEVNGVTFNTSLVPVPVLLQILSGNYKPQQLLPEGSVYYLSKNASVQLTFPAGVVGGPHPLHLHGHSFSVVRSAGSDTYNYQNPVRRDTVSMGTTGDVVTVRFDTNNPGPWFFHCHIDWHLNEGFAVVFAEDSEDVPTVIKPPAEWAELCPRYNTTVPRTYND